MQRQLTRLRRDYLYRKGKETQEQLSFEKRKKLKTAIDAGKPIPTELRAEASELYHNAQLDDEGHKEADTHIDDEYALAGISDPKILITSSRDPSSRLQQFIKELCLVFPNSQRMNRGSYVVKDMVDAARGNAFTDMIIVHEHRGEPNSMIISHLPHGPTAHFALNNCVLRHDIGIEETCPQVYPHLIMEAFTTPLGHRIRDIFKYLFPIAKKDSKRVITLVNRNDFLTFRHHMWDKTDAKKQKGGNETKAHEVDLRELGPRFEMKPYQIKLGTLDQAHAEDEWVLRPYMRTSRTRVVL